MDWKRRELSRVCPQGRFRAAWEANPAGIGTHLVQNQPLNKRAFRQLSKGHWDGPRADCVIMEKLNHAET